jgi:hypothetical protein
MYKNMALADIHIQHTCIYTDMHIYTCTYICICTYTDTYTHTHIHRHTYTHIHTHTHTHTHKSLTYTSYTSYQRAGCTGAQASGGEAQASGGGGSDFRELREGWEETADPCTGKICFVNHKTKKWSTNRPMDPSRLPQGAQKS